MMRKKNSKGSALLTALVVMTVLIVVGMGVLSASINNLANTDVVTLNERSYYASENAAQIAISTIKNEVSKYYMTMKNASTQAAYQTLYDNFFTYLSGRLTGAGSILSAPDFIENELDGKTQVVCVMDTPAYQESGYLGTTFTVTCTTTMEGISRTVRGSLRVDIAPLKFLWTSSPPLTGDILLLEGNSEIDCEGTENHLTVSGTSRMSGVVTNPCGFTSTQLVQNDTAVADLLIWKLYYNQFDKSIFDHPLPPIVTPASASNKYYFAGSTVIDKDINGKNIYCGGDLTLNDVAVNNCNIYVAGNLFLNNTEDPDRVKGTNIYTGGSMFINASNFWPDGIHHTYYYAGGSIMIVLGQGGPAEKRRSGRIDQAHFTAGGSISVTSAYLYEQEDIIINSSFKAGGSIEINGQTYLDNPLIDKITNSTFEAVGGSITIVADNMHSYNKLQAGDDILLANKGMSNTEIYADDNITIDSSRLYTGTQTQYYSSYMKVAAQDDLTIKNSSFTNSYFYSGESLLLQLASGYSIRNSILYSEEDATYDNTWTANMDTMQSSLIYTNADFYYGGSGTASSQTPAGLQVMAKGSAYSYEADDSSDATDKLIFGKGSYMNLDALHAMIGVPNTGTGVLAESLAAAGFEHVMPEPIVTLPYYTEVFISENYS